MTQPPTCSRILFVTGRLAEFALGQVLADLAPRAGFVPEIAVLPISVAALMTPRWVSRHLEVPPGIDRVILPGHCRGDLREVIEKARGVPVELGPLDLRELPRHFGQTDNRAKDYGAYDIEILAEINHAPRLPGAELIAQADRFSREGADVIDLGCEPGTSWTEIGDAVKAHPRSRPARVGRQLRSGRGWACGRGRSRAGPQCKRIQPRPGGRLGRGSRRDSRSARLARWSRRDGDLPGQQEDRLSG